MLIAYIITLSAIMFALRTLARARRENFLSDTKLTKIGTSYFFCLLALNLFQSPSIFLYWSATFAPLLAIFFMIEIGRFCRLRAFRKHFAESLNLTLLKMKSGKAFRQSINESIQELDAKHSARLREIFDIVVFTQQDKSVLGSRLMSLIVNELRIVDQNPHCAIRRLQTLRMRLKTEENFRRKSGQAVKQIRAQSLLMSGLFVAVLIFVVQRFGFARNQNLILISVMMFSLGIIWILLGGRKFKWNI